VFGAELVGGLGVELSDVLLGRVALVVLLAPHRRQQREDAGGAGADPEPGLDRFYPRRRPLVRIAGPVGLAEQPTGCYPPHRLLACRPIAWRTIGPSPEPRAAAAGQDKVPL
jgi:hypothetical protein